MISDLKKIMFSTFSKIEILSNKSDMFDFLTIFGSSAISNSLGVVIIWSLTILSLWISAVSFVYGWDAVSDFARWTRRVKSNPEIESDLVKLKELLN